MEKLQAALANARKARGGDDQPPSLQHRLKRRPSKSILLEQKWEDLKAFTPAPTVMAKHRIVTSEATTAATPFDILRTKILLQMKENGWKRLAITSPMPRAGKTTTACNLAMGVGRQKEIRSMLFDMDLRDPSVHNFFEQQPNKSIGSLFQGLADFPDQALRIGSNVALSMASYAERDPTRLLLSEETRDKLDDIQEEYEPDLMIFDLPSVLVGDDTRAFLKNVDCALIVVRAGKTRYGQFDTCEQEVAEQTNVLGVVVNAVQNYQSSQD